MKTQSVQDKCNNLLRAIAEDLILSITAPVPYALQCRALAQAANIIWRYFGNDGYVSALYSSKNK